MPEGPPPTPKQREAVSAAITSRTRRSGSIDHLGSLRLPARTTSYTTHDWCGAIRPASACTLSQVSRRSVMTTMQPTNQRVTPVGYSPGGRSATRVRQGIRRSYSARTSDLLEHSDHRDQHALTGPSEQNQIGSLVLATYVQAPRFFLSGWQRSLKGPALSAYELKFILEIENPVMTGSTT